MAALDPTAIIAAPATSPFTLVPIIKDLVRTRFPVPGSIFLVEGIQIAPLTKTGRWQVVRLLLGDGELCIQALLGDTMHRFVHTREVSVGTYVRIDDFQLRMRDFFDERGTSNKMVFLVVHDLSTVGWNRPVQELHKQQHQQHEQPEQDEIAHYEKAIVSKSHQSPARESVSASRSVPGTPTKGRTFRLGKRPIGKDLAQNDGTADTFEEFEALAFPSRKFLNMPSMSASKSSPTTAIGKKAVVPVALPRDWHDPQTPLKLTTLRSIPNLPYQQNWSCNILAIVTYLSPVEASHLPPYKQRTARVADPSTTKQVHLTVFLNPEEFTPKVGNAVLFIGVKNHKYDGGSLKKYASDNIREKWWMEDPWELKWCDVQGIKAWWADMEATQATEESFL